MRPSKNQIVGGALVLLLIAAYIAVRYYFFNG